MKKINKKLFNIFLLIIIFISVFSSFNIKKANAEEIWFFWTVSQENEYPMRFSSQNVCDLVKRRTAQETGVVVSPECYGGKPAGKETDVFISSLDKYSGKEGDQITVFGKNFINIQEVTFPNEITANFNVISENEIHFTIPSGSNSGKIKISSSSRSYAIIQDFQITTSEVVEVSSTGKNTSSGFNTKYNLLAPIGDFKEFETSNIAIYLNTMLKIMIGLCGALAVIMFIIYAVMYMGEESIFGKMNAKDKMTSSVVGLLIALGSWALLNTIDPDLLGGRGLRISPAVIEVDMNVHGDTAQEPVGGYYCGSKYKENSSWHSDQETRDTLLNQGISINKLNCKYVGQKDCTSVYNLNIGPVIALKNTIKAECPSCSLMITGGTECWLHSKNTKHIPGNSIVDLGDETIQSYVNTGDAVKTDGGYTQYTKNGTSFLDEGDHYHIMNW